MRGRHVIANFLECNVMYLLRAQSSTSSGSWASLSDFEPFCAAELQFWKFLEFTVLSVLLTELQKVQSLLDFIIRSVYSRFGFEFPRFSLLMVYLP